MTKQKSLFEDCRAAYEAGISGAGETMATNPLLDIIKKFGEGNAQTKFLQAVPIEITRSGNTLNDAAKITGI